jgi:hypothetical protein
VPVYVASEQYSKKNEKKNHLGLETYLRLEPPSCLCDVEAPFPPSILMLYT